MGEAVLEAPREYGAESGHWLVFCFFGEQCFISDAAATGSWWGEHNQWVMRGR